MRCPECGSEQIVVRETRQRGDGIRRRRECLDCGKRFSTMERVARGRGGRIPTSPQAAPRNDNDGRGAI